jgi:hypothetical protein
MPTYVCVKDNVITQIGKETDPALVLAPGEVQYIAPPVMPGADEPEVGWLWNDANPAPAAATMPAGEEKASADPGRAPEPPSDEPGAPPTGTPPQPRPAPHAPAHRGSRRE